MWALGDGRKWAEEVGSSWGRPMVCVRLLSRGGGGLGEGGGVVRPGALSVFWIGMRYSYAQNSVSTLNIIRSCNLLCISN